MESSVHCHLPMSPALESPMSPAPTAVSPLSFRASGARCPDSAEKMPPPPPRRSLDQRGGSGGRALIAPNSPKETMAAPSPAKTPSNSVKEMVHRAKIVARQIVVLQHSRVSSQTWGGVLHYVCDRRLQNAVNHPSVYVVVLCRSARTRPIAGCRAARLRSGPGARPWTQTKT